MAKLKNPVTIEPIHIKLTAEQKKAIVDYVKKTGHQPAISLLVDVVEGKIAPAAVTVGAA